MITPEQMEDARDLIGYLNARQIGWLLGSVVPGMRLGYARADSIVLFELLREALMEREGVLNRDSHGAA